MFYAASPKKSEKKPIGHLIVPRKYSRFNENERRKHESCEHMFAIPGHNTTETNVLINF